MQSPWGYKKDFSLLNAVCGFASEGIITVADRQYDLKRIVPVEWEGFQLFIVPDADCGAVAVIDDFMIFIDHCEADIIAVCAVEIKATAINLFQINGFSVPR